MGLICVVVCFWARLIFDQGARFKTRCTKIFLKVN